MRAFVICLVMPLLAVLALNISVDAGGVGATATIKRLAAEQREGDLIVAPLQLERRALVEALVEKRGSCADVLVTGSSTVGHIADGMLPGLKIVNAYLSGPSIEDFEAMTAILRRSTCRPKALILGADLFWLGNPQVDEKRWMVLVDDYLVYHADMSFPLRASARARVSWARIEEDLNFTTTRESASLELQRLRGSTELGARLWSDGLSSICAAAGSTPYAIAASDGHGITCPTQIPSESEREVIAEDYLRKNTHSMGEWRDIAYDRLDRLNALVGQWSREFGPVVIVGMPYHPTVYRNLLLNTRLRGNMTELDERLAKTERPGVEFVSLRDASLVPCSRSEFEDGHHPSSACAAKVATFLIDHTRGLKKAAAPR